MKIRFGLVASSAMLVAVGACASGGGGGSSASSGRAPTPGAEVLAQGESPRNNEFTRSADQHLRQAADASTPAEAAPHFQLALEAAEQGMAADPRNPLSHLQAGRAHIGLGDYEAAAAALDRAEELRPIYALETESLRERAWIDAYQQADPLVNGGQYEEAIPFLEQANAIYKERPEVMIVLGQIYSFVGENDKALETLREAMSIIQSDRIEQVDSATAASWNEQAEQLPTLIAQSLIQAERYGEAAIALRELLAEDPGNQLIAKNLATVFLSMEEPDSARVIYDDLMASGDLDANDYYQIGVGYYNIEDYRAAADAFKAGAEGSPTHRDAVEFWARSVQIIRQDMEEPDPATLAELEEAASRWLELDPNSRNAMLLLANVATQSGNDDRAREMVSMIEDLSLFVENLQLRVNPGGGGTVTGLVRNASLEPGSTITLDMEFFGPGNTSLGTEQVRVSAPPVDATQVFNVELDSDQMVVGYRYTAGS